ncbi:hypothetical protein CAPTEDRAFT_195907 [Capitella teleta]|uniref:Kinesin-like protein n=1 Tax=Capitella teleta TaxID=283909 RepID=R7TZ34_CAPTE|nr:hypothetical protein CAPTEDRAFT_195907 [Capitella teleta]|eukprot:ELT98872.1 hypothetical protein CAPTEDRAFT_195907 [Capitella teleta]
MASVKVAVRVRPFNQREINLGSSSIIDMHEETTVILNPKGDSRTGAKDFTFDHSYWSMDSSQMEKYASQQQVFKDLGLDVIKCAYEGYNACIFAYGQTGSGKTYTMMGRPGDSGLIPRICEELFSRMKDETMVYRTEVSYLEIYNEKVRDLVKISNSKESHGLRVREHPKEGPYVQDLSKHIVSNFDDISSLMEKGNANRTTASTNMNDTSSRSHAIFTLVFSQAKFSKNSPSETKSKIHLVDLAGSERADATGATGKRLKEGSSINKSLVTLSTVISTLADISEKAGSSRKAFIPYRDSTLTWLLKDSLGGNAKTIMIATLSPAGVNYSETLSTLRYANRAKSIVNKPTVNEDPNVKLIRELREEIQSLKSMLSVRVVYSSGNEVTPKVKEKLHESEARVKVLTEEWAERWGETASILQDQKDLALRKEGRGVVLDSELPHLIGIDDDLLSTGILLYHLKEGVTRIGTEDAVQPQDIELQGPEIIAEHCMIENEGTVVTLVPLQDALCMVNGYSVTDPLRLSQGAVIMLGKTNMFRFNHPSQAARLRKELAGVS